ncbi:unnamed protein product [Lupinus luteus]|uniref:UspA domain-containing protein n=1 Tax=Lupinus luteus TaxID=3873 RepID=A0AAV1WGT3_LUPLU
MMKKLCPFIFILSISVSGFNFFSIFFVLNIPCSSYRFNFSFPCIIASFSLLRYSRLLVVQKKKCYVLITDGSSNSTLAINLAHRVVSEGVRISFLLRSINKMDKAKEVYVTHGEGSDRRKGL